MSEEDPYGGAMPAAQPAPTPQVVTPTASMAPAPMPTFVPAPAMPVVAGNGTPAPRESAVKYYTKSGLKTAAFLAAVGLSFGYVFRIVKPSPPLSGRQSYDADFVSMRAKQFLRDQNEQQRKSREVTMIEELTAGADSSIKLNRKATPQQAKNADAYIHEVYTVTVKDIEGKRFLYAQPLTPAIQKQRLELQDEVAANMRKVRDVVSHPESAPAPKVTSKLLKPRAGTP